MKLNINVLKTILRAVIGTKEKEIGCGECYEQLDKFIELKLKGKSLEEAMPLVQDHLEHCAECRDEYEALLEALKSVSTAI